MYSAISSSHTPSTAPCCWAIGARPNHRRPACTFDIRNARGHFLDLQWWVFLAFFPASPSGPDVPVPHRLPDAHTDALTAGWSSGGRPPEDGTYVCASTDSA
jgi:hypothetical protein